MLVSPGLLLTLPPLYSCVGPLVISFYFPTTVSDMLNEAPLRPPHSSPRVVPFRVTAQLCVLRCLESAPDPPSHPGQD